MRVLVHCRSGPYQTLSNQYSAQVPLSHDCDPRPQTRHLGGGRVLAQAIRQLDKQLVSAMVANRVKVTAEVSALVGATKGYVEQTAEAVETNALRMMGRL
jgi:C1A family cysteine protease